jgi:hypothetical protein
MKNSFVITIFFICISLNCKSQTFIDTLKLDIQKYSLISIVKKDLEVLYDKKFYVSVNEIKYDFGAMTLNCEFAYDNNWYNLGGHYINDKIINIELSKKTVENDNTNYKSVFQFLDTILATKHLTEHNSFFSSNKKIDDFFYKKFERFGYSCGFAGQTPKSMFDCLLLIKNKNKEALTLLATSLTPTDRAYGVFGLYISSRLGNKLTIYENTLITLNQKSEAEAYQCSGCISGTQRLDILLGSKSLKWYYNWYKKTGKLY